MGRGVDTVLFDPEKRDISLRQSWGVWRDEIVFGVVGRLAREKNLVTVLSLYTRLQREFPDRGMKMVVVGGRPHDERLAQRISGRRVLWRPQRGGPVTALRGNGRASVCQ